MIRVIVSITILNISRNVHNVANIRKGTKLSCVNMFFIINGLKYDEDKTDVEEYLAPWQHW